MKFSYATLAEVPEALKSFYKEVDGKWVIQCEGAVSSDKLGEFRDKNITLQKEIDAHKAAWGDLKPEEMKALKAREQEIADGKIKNDNEFKTKLDERIKAMQAEHATALAAKDKELGDARGELNRAVINTALLAEANTLGLVDGAADDLIHRGSKAFIVENGKPVAVDASGAKIYGTDAQPLTMTAWMAGLAKTNAYLFKPSQGGGSAGGAGGGGGGGGGASGVNPYKTGAGFNRTEQALLMKADPEKAKRLAAEAGFKLPTGYEMKSGAGPGGVG